MIIVRKVLVEETLNLAWQELAKRERRGGQPNHAPRRQALNRLQAKVESARRS